MDYLDPTSINGLNLYAYCNNDPVNLCDPSGHLAISAFLGIIIGVVALAATANDIYQIIRENDGVNAFLLGENVHIKNSYKLITPWMQWGYAIYLNYFNNSTKDIIEGSSAGVSFEWFLHNLVYWCGFGGKSAKHLDVGKTIFADGQAHPLIDKDGNMSGNGLMSLAMRIGYIGFTSPIYWTWDLIVNGGF